MFAFSLVLYQSREPESYFNPRKGDPVRLYHKYEAYWNAHGIPGEDPRKELRWNIRSKLMTKDYELPVVITKSCLIKYRTWCSYQSICCLFCLTYRTLQYLFDLIVLFCSASARICSSLGVQEWQTHIAASPMVFTRHTRRFRFRLFFRHKQQD